MNILELFEYGKLDNEYSDWLMSGNSRTIICNGDTLIAAMEDGVNTDNFIEYLKDQMERS